MSQKRKQYLLELTRIVVVVIIALAIGFAITAMVSNEPVEAYKALLTGPLPKISLVDGLEIKGINRFGNWIEDSTTLILIGLAVAIVFSARQFSLGAEGQIFMGALAAGGEPVCRCADFYSPDFGSAGRRHRRFFVGADSGGAQGVSASR
jgi:ABC-type uncharacterized transport system permease subunit